MMTRAAPDDSSADPLLAAGERDAVISLASLVMHPSPKSAPAGVRPSLSNRQL
jgi:hypothetical protein